MEGVRPASSRFPKVRVVYGGSCDLSSPLEAGTSNVMQGFEGGVRID